MRPIIPPLFPEATDRPRADYDGSVADYPVLHLSSDFVGPVLQFRRDEPVAAVSYLLDLARAAETLAHRIDAAHTDHA